VICCGALSHHTNDNTRWIELLKEFTRFTKYCIFIMLNLKTPYENEEDRQNAINDFKNFDYNGFKLVFCEND
jgi:hypothetical protein